MEKNGLKKSGVKKNGLENQVLMKWYWKLYLVLLLTLGYGQLLRKIITETGGVASRYSAAIIATILVVALIAKSKEIALGKLWMWRMLFFILTTAIVLMPLFSIYLGLNGVLYSAVLLFVGSVVMLPATRELYNYCFKSSRIWTSGIMPSE